MLKEESLQLIEKKVREKLKQEKTGHDWFHVERVLKTALEISEQEQTDDFIVAVAVLLHDVIDDKVVKDEKKALKEVCAWMQEAEISGENQAHILEIIQTISFKGGNEKKLATTEAKVVQDADRLDAIGAIGIARCFTYAGSKGDVIDDPELPVRTNMTVEEYRRAPSTAINHFYEKLLKLKEKMNTTAGIKEAERRHAFMEQFLKEFYRETRT